MHLFHAHCKVVVNLVVRTTLLDQLQGSHSTIGLVGSLQLIHLSSSDNQIDHSHVLGLVSVSVDYSTGPIGYIVEGYCFRCLFRHMVREVRETIHIRTRSPSLSHRHRSTPGSLQLPYPITWHRWLCHLRPCHITGQLSVMFETIALI